MRKFRHAKGASLGKRVRRISPLVVTRETSPDEGGSVAYGEAMLNQVYVIRIERLVFAPLLRFRMSMVEGRYPLGVKTADMLDAATVEVLLFAIARWRGSWCWCRTKPKLLFSRSVMFPPLGSRKCTTRSCEHPHAFLSYHTNTTTIYITTSPLLAT